MIDGVLHAGRELVEQLEVRGPTVRLLGGVAVALHCETGGRPHRDIDDIDIITSRRDASRVDLALAGMGFEGDRRFNALHGDRRMIFRGPNGKLDVFVGSFEMCHRLSLEHRLGLDPLTLTASDLLLTKLQVVELTAKDQVDAVLLLRDHKIGRGDGDHLDLDYLTEVVTSDWGLWRTASGTLRRVAESALSVRATAAQLLNAWEQAPKSRGFRVRAKVGEHIRWYDLPDEAA